MITHSTNSQAKLLRKAFVMAVNPGQAEEYALRHSPIWPELAATLKSQGVSSYSIFYHATTRPLFGYVEIEDETRWLAIARTEICQRWRRHMKEIMPTNADLSPACANLVEVFHLD